jgi:hypothetical protein
MNNPTLRPKTQVTYVPSHANGDASHPDCEHGFVYALSTLPGMVAVRYFRKGWRYHFLAGSMITERDIDDAWENLRTKSNSEITRIENLQVDFHVPYAMVEALIQRIKEQKNETR